jgi:hypothetical protein
LIDISTEKTLSLAQAAKILPPGRNGRSTHVATLSRWIVRGVRGVRLDAARIGGRWITSEEAIDRFSSALTADRLPANQPMMTAAKVTATRQRELERVDRELVALGL